MGMSATAWAHQLDAFGDAFDVVAYDTRGHGHTGGSERDSYTMELYALDLRALLAALDVTRPVLVGASMGGAIVQQYAATYPDDVAGLVLVDPISTVPVGWRGRAAMGFVTLLSRLDRVVPYDALNRLQIRAYETLSPGSAGNADAILELMAADPPIAHAELVKIADATTAFPRSDLDPTAITAPTLVCYGDAIPSTLATMATGLETLLSNADVDVVTIPDAGHGSVVDNPAVVTDSIRAFLDTVS
jgi:pimeloyl-ACP methyl ester carboxylesterase